LRLDSRAVNHSKWSADLCTGVLAENDRKIQSLLRGIREAGDGHEVMLDVGCWDGGLTVERAAELGAERLLGVEVFEAEATAAEARGIDVARLDLETDPFPWPDGSVDVVICNQVLEHLKNIWLPMSEMHRVLRPGGIGIFSVPNLGSLHNRLLLAAGRQPTSIRIFGPHVRSYTFGAFCELVEFEGAYDIERKVGTGFYPIPSPWSLALSKLWRGASHTIIVSARKVSEDGGWMRDGGQGSPGSGQTFYAAPTRA
jgi:SAM-dependent methyltransferase